MKLVGRDILEQFIFQHADARGAIASWVAEIDAVSWSTQQEIKGRYATASFLADNTVIFNIKGGAYRLVVRVAYRTSVVLVLWIGTHAEYSKR
jgi:mRNA interferase HigB